MWDDRKRDAIKEHKIFFQMANSLYYHGDSSQCMYIVHFKCVKCIVWQLFLNKAEKKTKRNSEKCFGLKEERGPSLEWVLTFDLTAASSLYPKATVYLPKCFMLPSCKIYLNHLLQTSETYLNIQITVLQDAAAQFIVRKYN